MQNDTTRFTRNIFPLQNFQSNITGLTPYSVVASNVANLQKMVDFTTKTIHADTIQAYTMGNTIQVKSPLSSEVSSSGSITNGGTSIQTFTTVGETSTVAISLGVRNTTVFNILGNGNALYSDPTGVATAFTIQGVTLSAPAATFSTITTDTCYAKNYVTLSDIHVKRNIREWREPILYTLSTIKPYTYMYDGDDTKGSGRIGLLAQQVADIYPQCVTNGDAGTYVNYDSIVALLVGAVRELSAKVAKLEAASRP